jgi:hypothetical protein
MAAAGAVLVAGVGVILLLRPPPEPPEVSICRGYISERLQPNDGITFPRWPVDYLVEPIGNGYKVSGTADLWKAGRGHVRVNWLVMLEDRGQGPVAAYAIVGGERLVR